MSTPGGDAELQGHVSLMTAIRRVLRPLVRLAMRSGITYPALSDLLKGLYIELAEAEHAGGAPAPASDSRISLLTGVHRKYVRRLREEEATRAPGFSMPRGLSLGVQIAALWNSRPDYLDETGQPRHLPRQSPTPGAPSFDALVASVSKDFRARVVLDEFLRLGVVDLDDEGRVRLVRAAYVPVADLESRAYYLGRNGHDHLDVIARNVIGEETPLPDRCVHYENLSREACDALIKVAEKSGMRALRAVNDSVQAGGATAGEGQTPWQMNFGFYFHMAPAETAARPPTASEADPNEH